MIKNNYDLSKPVQMVSMAQTLKKHVVDQKLYTPILGKNYVQVEGWEFAGGLLGLYPRVSAVENLSTEHEIKWKADVEIVRLADKEVVGRGFAVCSNKESKKKSFDEYAILSMAQTRAIGKSYRNIIGWVMKMAGYEATPSEEMAKMGEVVPTPTTIKSTAKQPKVASKIEKEPECSNCAEIISEAEAKFSKARFGNNLCRNCQKEYVQGKSTTK